MRKIKVRICDTARNGIVFKWTDRSGKPRQRSHVGKSTKNAVAEAKVELEDELNRTGAGSNWARFRLRYERMHLLNLERRSQGKPRTMMDRFETVLRDNGVDSCSEITEEHVFEVEENMLCMGIQPSTVQSNMQTLWAVLNWGADRKLLPRLHRPRRRTTKKERQQRKSKGRSLTLEEIDRMIAAVKANPIVNPDCKVKYKTHVRQKRECPERIVRAIQAMRFLGLRLEDCQYFHWEPRDDCHYPVNLHGKTPMLHLAVTQKSGEEQEIPLTPDAVAWLRSLENDGSWICRMSGAKGEHDTTSRLSVVIANAGKAANIKVKDTGGRGGKPKFASAHDLRRTFATHWLEKLTIREVQVLTRHADLQTLLTYYTDAKPEALAKKLSELSGGFLVDEQNRESSKTS